MDQLAFHHNWICANHNQWADIVPDTIRFYPVSYHRDHQNVFYLAYIYNAPQDVFVDNMQNSLPIYAK